MGSLFGSEDAKVVRRIFFAYKMMQDLLVILKIMGHDEDKAVLRDLVGL